MWVAPRPIYWRYPPLSILSLSSSEIPCAKAEIGINKNNNIKPKTIEKAIKKGIEEFAQAEEFLINLTGEQKDEFELRKYISELEYEMELAGRNLQFEKAAALRDKIKELGGFNINRDR